MSKAPRMYTFGYVTALLNEIETKNNEIIELRKALSDLYLKNISGFPPPDTASLGDAHVWGMVLDMFRDSEEQGRAGVTLLKIKEQK